MNISAYRINLIIFYVQCIKFKTIYSFNNYEITSLNSDLRLVKYKGILKIKFFKNNKFVYFFKIFYVTSLRMFSMQNNYENTNKTLIQKKLYISDSWDGVTL